MQRPLRAMLGTDAVTLGPDPDDALAASLLRADPEPPADPARFSSDGAPGPGCYPDGPPMIPAADGDVPDDRVAVDVARLGAAAETWWADAPLAAKVPDDRLRAAAAALAATVGAPLLPLVVDGLVARIEWGEPGATRVAGRADGDASVVLVNERYRHEHPALLAGSVLHQLCSPPDQATTHPREVLLHGLLSVVQVQVLDALPELADEGTELARRQHSLVLSLLDSRPRGRPEVRIIAPGGAGTIPGGAPAMQTPDFWSIPFASGDDPSPAPPAVRAVLGPWVPEVHDVLLGSFGRPLVDVVDDHVLGAVLPPALRVRAMAALGLLPCGADDPGRRFAPVRVRRAVVADAGRLADIHLAARRDAMPSIEIPHPPADVVRHLRDEVIGGRETWAAVDGDEVVGYLALGSAAPSGVGEVEHLYVDPEHTRRGIGARLLDLAMRRHPDGLELWVFQANAGARRFYERRGFRPVRFTDGRGNQERAPDVRERWLP